MDSVSCIEYYPGFINEPETVYDNLLNLPFKDRYVLDDEGKEKYKLQRSTCVFGDEGISDDPPRIWGSDNPIRPWTPELYRIKNKIEDLTKKKYNVCLCNYYESGKKAINWHSDNEEKGSISSIASVSLGSERRFEIRNKETGQVNRWILQNGSLFLMKEGCQENYIHRLPKDKSQTGRINLTFRLFDKMRYLDK